MRDRRGRIRIARAAESGPLQWVTPEELGLRATPLTTDPNPNRQIRAWVRFGAVPTSVRAVVARWTADAVGIELKSGEATYRCWVWAGAIQEIPEPG